MSDSDENSFGSYDGPVTTKRSTFAWHDHQYQLELKHQRFAIRVQVKRNGELVGLLQGNLLERPSPSFFAFADEVSQELQGLAVTFADRRGIANRVKHPQLTGDQEAIDGGGFFHIYTVEVKPEATGQDLGLRIVHETLQLLKNEWTLAVMVPGSLSSRFCHWKTNVRIQSSDGIVMNASPQEANEIDNHTKRVTRHFARMGFAQADKGDAWFLTKNGYFATANPVGNWLTKEQAKNIEILEPAKLTKPTGIHKELADKVVAFPESLALQQTAAIRELEDLVRRGASIHTSGAMQLAAANHKELTLLKALVRLGGNVNRGDGLGNTPLHIAASLKRTDTIQYLLSVGANVAATNADGKTPLQCLEDAEQSHDDFRAAFGLDGEAREIDILPKLNSYRALMPQATKNLLVDGWMSPRMRHVLLITAEIEMDDALDPYRITFEPRQPKPIAECCESCGDGINRVDYIPASVFKSPINQQGLYQSFNDGWAYCFMAIACILNSGGVPTVNRMEQYLQSGQGMRGDYDARKYRHFVDKGGKAEYALDAVIDISRNVAVHGDDGWEYGMFEEEIEANPATPFDKAFDIARFKCINQGGGTGTARGPYRETSRLGREDDVQDDFDDMDGDY